MDAGPGLNAAEPWWQGAVGYQIYPMSFADSDGDGIGDIGGIIGRLDYLADLGIGFVWLSPVYASPMVDNGYDIADYQAINPLFGTLADFDALVAGARARGIGIVMDLVVNHTSDRHAWFVAACGGRKAALRDYYIWRDPAPGGGPPDGQRSVFGGPAWTLHDGSGQYFYHQFAPGQPDLNWHNPALRTAIHAMMNWWLDRGIAGFRMDVIDLIGKEPDRGITAGGPMLHAYIREMSQATLAGRGCVSVGETWSATPDNALLFCGRARGELSMVFQFSHVTAFWGPGGDKWAPRPIDLAVLKGVFARWQAALADDGWNALFWSNHDLPRAVSRYGDAGAGRVASAKLLATVLHLMRGTPYIYQGEELGMVNAGFARLEDYRDIETLNAGAEAADLAAFLAGARANSRDNARTPMQWDAGPQAGFTGGVPWIAVNANHTAVNAAAEAAEPDGVLARYRALVRLRRELAVVRQGDFTLLAADDPAVFAYRRRLGGDTLTVVANWSGQPAAVPAEVAGLAGRDVFGGGAVCLAAGGLLAGWEVVVVQVGAMQ